MKKTTLIFFFITHLVVAQTPCVNGFAGEYPCKNYDLMSHVPVATLANTNGTPEGSDIWGWTDPLTGKEYAIAAMTNSTAFIDITDPINPKFLGRLNSSAGNNYWRDVKIYKNYAFIVADNVGNHGMQVFDLTKLRTANSSTLHAVDKLYSDVTSCHNIFINEDTNIAYLVDCKNVGRGVHFVDISDPVNPVNLGNYNNEGVTHDAQAVIYKGPDSRYLNKEIFIGSNENKVVILDVTNKNDVKKISSIDYTQLGYTHQGWFTEDQRYFILGDETDEQNFGMKTRTLVFDFSDLQLPKLSSTYFGPTNAIDHNGYVKGNEFFMANYRAGLRVLDISNIASPTNSMTEIGFFDTHPANNGTGFNGAWSVYPYFASGNIIVNDIERGLFVLRKSGTLNLNAIKENDFSIFPNPTKDKVTINLTNNNAIENIEVFSILGQKVFKKSNISLNSFVLETKPFKSGVYIIKINNNVSKKIVIQK